MLSSCPFLKSPSSRIKKRPRTLVQISLFEISILQNKKKAPDISSDFVARGVCYVLPQSKNRQMTSSKNQPIIQPNLQWVFAGIGNQEKSHASGDSRRTPEQMTSSSWRPYLMSSGE
jgi:hypothetical protein